MSIESRRASIQKLIVSEGIAGRPIEDDADFLSLAERWIHREIDMMELRRLYEAVRKERRRRKWNPHPASEPEPLPSDPPPSADEFLAEFARMPRSDFSE